MDNLYPTQDQLSDYIRKSAASRGINPDVALRVALSEGLRANPADGWQSNVVKNGKRETSYSPFQLYVGGGLGDRFIKDTGLNPSDPNNVYKTIDYALDTARKEGWGAWYGAKKEGITGFMGISRMENGVPINDGSVPAQSQAGPVTTGTDAQTSYDYYSQTGVNSMPNAANAGKPQVNVYGHVNWTRVDPQVKDYLGVASARLGIPLNITSGFRDLNHPVEAKKGPHALHRHTTGKSVDLDIGGYSDQQKQMILETLVSMGATGVGIYPGGKMLHVDWTGMGGSYKGKGTVSTWDRSGENPAWYANGLARGLQFQKEGKFPDGIALNAQFPTGNYASIPADQQRADMSYGAGVYPDQASDQTDYLRAQNDRSLKGLDLEGTSYADTIGAAFYKSWVLTNATASVTILNNAPDPNYSIEKDLPRVTEGIPADYQEQFLGATSARQADMIRAYVLKQMERDQLIADNPKMGIGASILAEIVDPVALTAAWATEGLAAPLLYGAKIGRIGRALRIGFAAGAGNVAAEGALDAVDPQRHTITDYGVALGAGMFLGTGLGYFAKGNTAVDAALREEIANLGQAQIPKEVPSTVVGAQQVGGTSVNENILSNEGQFDWEDLGDAEEAGVGRKIGNATANPFSDPLTKAEKIGPEAFLGARQVIPDPRGARNGEVVEQTVVDRYVTMFKAGIYDWETTAFAQYKKWAKRTKQGFTASLKRGFALDDVEANEFFKKVSEYVEETDPLKKEAYDPEVKAVGDKKASLYSTLRREGEARRIAGMPLEDDPNYTPFYRDDEQLSIIMEKFDYLDMQRIIDNVVDRKFNEATPALKEAISKGWLNNITRASLSAQDGVQRVFAKGDRTELIAFLRDELGVKDQTIIDEFMGLNIIRQLTQEGKEITPRVKSRTFDLEDYKLKTFVKYKPDYKGPRSGKRNAAGEEGEEVSLRDFFQKNAHAQMTRYMRDMSGVYAWADMKVYNPKTSELILDGVRDDADFDKFKKWIRDSSLARDKDKKDQVDALLKELDYVYQETRHSGGSNPRMWKGARRMMMWSFIHFMQNLGINQAQEFTNIISGMGIRAAVQGIPAFRRMLDEAGKSVPIDPVMRDLQALIGKGDNVFMGARRHYLTEEMLGNEAASKKAGKMFDQFGGKASALVSKISGMEYVDNALQNWTMRAAAQYFANIASEYGEKAAKGAFKLTDIDTLFAKDSKRLRALGLSDEKLIRIMNQFRKHSGVTDAKTRLRELNLDKWDAVALSDFRTALDRWSSRAIQYNDIGTLSRHLTHPVAKFILQFRSFIFGAFGKQTMYGLNHFDGRTMANWMLQTMAGAATWYLFTKTMSMGEKNPEKYMEKKLGKEDSWEYYRNLGMAGLNRSGWTSIFPMIYDTGAAFTGAPTMQGRVSGQATAAWGSPLVSMFDQAGQATRDAIDSFSTGRPQSRQEIKNNTRVLLGNWLPLMAFLGMVTQDRPERDTSK